MGAAEPADRRAPHAVARWRRERSRLAAARRVARGARSTIRTQAAIAASSDRRVAGDRAWRDPQGRSPHAPVPRIESTYGLADDRAWKWRRTLLERAPKVVMRSLGLARSIRRAWELRERVVGTLRGGDGHDRRARRRARLAAARARARSLARFGGEESRTARAPPNVAAPLMARALAEGTHRSRACGVSSCSAVELEAIRVLGERLRDAEQVVADVLVAVDKLGHADVQRRRRALGAASAGSMRCAPPTRGRSSRISARLHPRDREACLR